MADFQYDEGLPACNGGQLSKQQNAAKLRIA